MSSPEPAHLDPAADGSVSHQDVAAAVALLHEIDQQPLDAQPDAFERLHAGLTRALADIDDA